MSSIYRSLKRSEFWSIIKSMEKVRKSVYLILEEPGSSVLAKILTGSIMCCITMSTILIIVDSMAFAELDTDYQSFGGTADLVITIIFLVEIFLRIFSFTSFGDSFIKYFTLFNILDVMAVLPTFFELILSNDSSLKQFRVIRAIRFIKVFRMLKVSRYLKGFSLLTEGIIRSFKTMMIYTIILFVLNIFMATIMYFVSLDEELIYAPGTKIETLPEAMWWALATMTTVGYGDKLPQSGYSRVVAILTAVVGLSMISMPIAVLGKDRKSVV